MVGGLGKSAALRSRWLPGGVPMEANPVARATGAADGIHTGSTLSPAAVKPQQHNAVLELAVDDAHRAVAAGRRWCA